MDIPDDILEVLKCNVCNMYLSRGPVYLQHDGVAVCGRCFSSKRPATRNTQYEATAKLLLFPCKNREFGCEEKVSFVDEDQELSHDAACEYRQYVCPVLGSARCDWIGTRKQILKHVEEQHTDRMLTNPCNVVHDISTSSLNNYILKAFNLLFLLHTKICVTTGKLYHEIRKLGDSDNIQDYIYKLHIKRGNESLIKEGRITEQGCLVLQEPTALGLDINSLLSVLGGWDGTTTTVTVEQRWKCTGCKANIAALIYRDENGWRCKQCAPKKKNCKNEIRGCTHQDIPKKNDKHDRYFCRSCRICNTDMCTPVSGDMSSHFVATHSNITHRTGSTWKATWTGEFSQRYSLVTSPAGTAVCWYNLGDPWLVIEVNIPVPIERLCEFRCKVRVTQPSTGLTHNYEPKIIYNRYWDWRIDIDEEDFPVWSHEFHVCVDITKIEV